MVWTNLVQGYNTKKSDGTGREILQENHRLVFNGVNLESFVELIPLEDVTMEIWYGFQWITDNAYNLARYIGATNRQLYNTSSANSNCGDTKCCHYIGYNETTMNEMLLDVDEDYDLGDHKFLSGDKAMFTQTYGKGYCYIIKNTDLDDGNLYGLHGCYTFRKRRLAAAEV